MSQNKILPGGTIGIIGGGQLGRMMATTAKHMGYRIVVLDPTPDCPTAQVSDDHIVADYGDHEAIASLMEKSDVITYEFESVDVDAAKKIEKKGLLPQGSNLLKITQDREQEKTIMVKNKLPVAPFEIIHNENELQKALDKVGTPSVLKTCTGGYDGKGQLKLTSAEDRGEARQFVEKNGRCILEKWVPFEKEISVVFTRAKNGDISLFPLAENEHKDHILHQTTAPAVVSESIREQALHAAEVIAESMDIVGTFAVEMFVCENDIYINEMAPRPHNSGHYTIEACNVSQFEQHIRAICGLPLVPIRFHGSAIMINLLGEDLEACFSSIDHLRDAHIHVYGKEEIKPKRKMGHLTFVGNALEELHQVIENYKITTNKEIVR
ncbi:5-(carboxyamino)imidazole ribonucleotide synthase [Aquibacillus albus]|uniref:N5-carboxyaminoimidazole ribonucleotide synthase n=1 Tax=Aquibacillus albus TaxID=1168171 RepID=A0ABS2N3R3_9BACI|nr:5-(carboxyamino)imidazole ribonucleotide synthase [Aquibacillus albus]MBM7572782.1 5-(carboxyamino)imidazole ribonucleotide synthase [Aquibacillus albus]